MSSWLEQQNKNAFSIYRQFIALNLHFKEGSGFDYVFYEGQTKVTMEGFLGKPIGLKRKFMTLYEKTKKLDHEDFLFANIRNGNNSVEGMLSDGIRIHEEWSKKYSNKGLYRETAKNTLAEYVQDHPKQSLTQLFIELLANDDDDLTELIIWGMLHNSGLEQVLQECSKENIFHELHFKHIMRIKAIYLYFDIL